MTARAEDLSVADQLLLEQLEPDVRALIERVVASRLEDAGDRAWRAGYNLGFANGRQQKMAAVPIPPKDPRA